MVMAARECVSAQAGQPLELGASSKVSSGNQVELKLGEPLQCLGDFLKDAVFLSLFLSPS